MRIIVLKSAQPVHDLNEFFALAGATGMAGLEHRKRSRGAILYTSGSTGKPKGVMLSHEQVMAGSSIVSDYLGITAERPHHRSIAV